MFSQIGPLEIVLIVVVLLLVFGPKRLPSLGRSLGTGMREFKESIAGEDKHRDEPDDADAGRPALSQGQADVAPTAGSAAQSSESTPEQRA